ncbi:MAG: OmpA family protein [Bacteroidia bacterium]|nr:OmpA family protein [Bacteroidia bacterium]HQU99730.1 OmpA family protein [Bacteroidia bacterium]
MAHATPTNDSKFTTNLFLIYMLSTAVLVSALIYCVGATHTIDHASNPHTGLKAPAVGHGGHEAHDSHAADTKTEPHAAETHAAVKHELPGGLHIEVAAGSIEDKLIAFIQDPHAQVSKDLWFDFNDLLFKTNEAVLEPQSMQQLKNVAAIFKAFPAVKAKIGGYTDNTGDAQANLKLSDARAKSVMQTLVTEGIAADRLEAEGYGQEHAVASNDTEEGRALNRRISLSVRAK